MVTTDIALLADAFERLGELKNSVDREREEPATDQSEAVSLAKVELLARQAQDAIFDVLLACRFQVGMPQAKHVLDRLLKGRE